MNNTNAPIPSVISASAWEGTCRGDGWAFLLTVLPPVPPMNQPANVTACAGTPVAVMFSGGGSGATYEWTNDNPAIGLSTSGAGNLSFLGTTLGDIEVGHLTVTPENGICSGQPRLFTISIRSSPTMNTVGNRSVCAGSTVKIEFSSTDKPTYAWTNSNTAIGLAGSGSDNIQFNAASVTAPQTGFVSVVPTQNGCSGAAQVFSIIVNPPISVIAADVKLACDTLPTVLDASTTSNPASFLWSGPNGFVSSLQNPTITDLGAYFILVTNPNSGCTATDTAFLTNCCTTKAGSIDTTSIILCENKPFLVKRDSNEILEKDDKLTFILFTDKMNPFNSILAYSDTALFFFLPDTMQLDSVYYVIGIAADTLPHDSINLTDNCLSKTKIVAVKWIMKPTITQLPINQTICSNGCVELAFEFTGNPPFSYKPQLEQNGVFLYDKIIQSTDFIQNITLCPIDFALPMAGGELHVLVSAFSDAVCKCGN